MDIAARVLLVLYTSKRLGNKLILNMIAYTNTKDKSLFLSNYLCNAHCFTNCIMKMGYIDLTKWVYDYNFTISFDDYSTAIMNGHYKIMRWIESCKKYNHYIERVGVKYNYRTLIARCTLSELATSGGSVKILKLFSQRMVLSGSKILENAIKFGHLKLVKWIAEHYSDDFKSHEYYIVAVRHGRLDILKYIMSFPEKLEYFIYHLKDASCLVASAGGHLDVLKWLLCDLLDHPTIINMELTLKRLSFLPHFLETMPQFCVSICLAAANCRQLHVLKWLKEKGFSLHRSICKAAVDTDCIELLIWLRENRCPWYEKICTRTAGNGCLEILKWAMSNGDKYDENTLKSALVSGEPELVKWLLYNKCPLKRDEVIPVLRKFTFINSHVEICNLFIEYGYRDIIAEVLMIERNRGVNILRDNTNSYLLWGYYEKMAKEHLEICDV